MGDDYWRQRAREDCTQKLFEHNRKMGLKTTYEEAQRYINRRADRIDAHRDRNYKGPIHEKD